MNEENNVQSAQFLKKAIKETDKKKDKKSGKSRIKELQELLSKVSEENKDLKDKLLRNMADFENFKKRKSKEFSELSYYISFDFAKDILQILDQLELSLKSSKENGNFDSFYKGVLLIYNNFLEMLNKKGIKPFESVGKEFNVEQHEAVMQVEAEEQSSNIVIEEYQKGYLFNDRILRHAKVVVCK